MSYPYKAWKLQPLFKPMEVEVIGRYSEQYEDTATGGVIHKSELYPTKAAAIAAGYAKLKLDQEALDKRQAKLNKRLESLKKAETK